LFTKQLFRKIEGKTALATGAAPLHQHSVLHIAEDGLYTASEQGLSSPDDFLLPISSQMSTSF